MNKLLQLLMWGLISQTLWATELNYNWKAGNSYNFSAEVKENVNTSMMGMKMQDQFITTTDFTLNIQNVNASGEAVGILYLKNFKVVNSSGQVLASMSDIPAKAVKSDIKVDRKGKFTFLKKVFLITSAKGNVLAYGKVDKNSARAGGQAGNMKVEAYAEFDPKTGKIKTGYKVEEVKETTSVEVKMTEDTDMVDVLPYKFLELLALPEGDVNENDKISVNAGIYKMDVLVKSMSGGVATINHKMGTDKSANMMGGGASGSTATGGMFDMNMDTDVKEGDVDTNMDMDMGENMDIGTNMNTDIGTGGTDMGGMLGGMGSGKSMAPKMTCDMNSQFNYTKGMFENVKGTSTTNINASGMKMTVEAEIEMRLVR